MELINTTNSGIGRNLPGAKTFAFSLGLALSSITGTHISADEYDWLRNARIALDTSVRSMQDTRNDNYAGMQFFGLDAHNVFTNQSGDVGTLLVQVYATSLHDMEKHPGLFKHENDTQIIYRNVNFNYTALFGRALNFRVGHFEIPVGLEQVENTNGTLRDYNHGRNIGVKGDWGFSLNGDLDTFEYELAWTRGSGNEWETLGDPGILAGRIGTRRDRNWMLGMSVLDGEVYQAANPTRPMSRKRIGIDAAWYWRRFEFMGEVFTGDDDGDDVRNGLVEANLRARDASWFIYSQVRRFEKDTTAAKQKASSVAVGIEFEPDNHWNFSAELNHDIEVFGAGLESNLFRAQLRYRFN